MTDPTNTYEARAEMQADFELEDYMLKKKIFEYMDGIHLVNQTEVYGAAQKARANTFYPDKPDYQMDGGEMLDAQEYAEMYIKEKNIQFDDNGDIIDNPLVFKNKTDGKKFTTRNNISIRGEW